jgi:hypothetical protein
MKAARVETESPAPDVITVTAATRQETARGHCAHRRWACVTTLARERKGTENQSSVPCSRLARPRQNRRRTTAAPERHSVLDQPGAGL